MILEERNVKDVLDIDITRLKEEKKIEEFKNRDAIAKNVIVQCVTDKHLDCIKNAKTAKEMIAKLEELFERKTVFNKLHLKRKLLSMKCGTNEKLEDHFLKFDSLVRELETAGMKLEETDKVCHLLLTMNETYDAVITAIETVNTELNIEFVKSRLLDAELKFNSKIEEKPNETSFKAFPYECYKCGKKGHKASQCSKNENYSNRGRKYYETENQQNRSSSTNQRYEGRYQRTNQQYRNTNSNQQYGGRYQDRGYYKEKANSAESEVGNGMTFVALNCQITENNIFILDSGCTEHMIKEELEENMKNVRLLEKHVEIQIANGKMMIAKKRGEFEGICQGISIKFEALIVEGMTHNLLSVGKLVNNNNEIIFKKSEVCILGNGYRLTCKKKKNLFTITINTKQCNKEHSMISNLWHQRLGHLNRHDLKQLGLPHSKEKCEACVEGKISRPYFTRNLKTTRCIGEIIHTDICGPISPPTLNNEKYFQVLIDDYSHFTMVKLLKSKNEAEQNIMDYVTLIKTQQGYKTKKIRCDNGGEFLSNRFKSYCRSKGIELQYTMAYTPQQNGISERMNRTLVDKVRTKLIETSLPKYLWGEAIFCSTYELNRSPTKALPDGKIPADYWYGKRDLTKLRIFGCRAWIIRYPRKDKFEPKGKMVRMVGYCGGGYRLWDSEQGKVVQSRDVIFDETVVKLNKENEGKLKIENMKEVEIQKDVKEDETYNEEKAESQENKQEEKSSSITLRSGKQLQKRKILEEYEVYTAYCLLSCEKDPASYDEAIEMKNGWEKAIRKEIDAHEKMNTWSVTNLPKGKTAIDAKWIFRTKEDGTKKARLVARGYQIQEENRFGIMYAPVARISTLRMLLAQAVQKRWKIKQLDIPTAFLNGKLESEVYLKTPKGITTQQYEVLKLNRGLYGLRESPKCWNNCFNEFATKYGFERSKYDFCLYKSETAWLIIYVDDILVIGEDDNVNKVINSLKAEFAAKEIGEIKNFLGMEILRDENSLKISQTKQVEKIFKKFGMENSKPSKTPIEKGFQVDLTAEKVQLPYRELIGSLMYISTISRPDITYATSYLSQFLDKPTQQCWNQAKRVLRYLKGTKNLGLKYKPSSEFTNLQAYSDSDWGGDKTDRKSISGSIIFFNGNPVTWFSRKQGCVALSTAESEYISAAATATEILNLKGLVADFGEENLDITLFIDNMGAISIIQSYENSKRTKHIDIRSHFIKDLIVKNILHVNYVESNIVEIFKQRSYVIKTL